MVSVQNPQQFLKDFTQQAEKAERRIYLQSMLFEYGKVLSELEPILIKKAKEGLEVQIHIDWVSQRYSEGNPNIILPLYGEKRRRMLHVHHQSKLLRDRLTDAGVIITFTNPPGLITKVLSIFGRNHKKLYIVDDDVWVGGINLFDMAFDNIDVMVKFTESEFLEILSKEFYKINENKHQENYCVSFNKDSELLVDAGLVGKSLIYDEAIMLIQQATKSITFVSQFVPEVKLLNALIEASDRDVDITVITSPMLHEYFVEFPYKITYQLFLAKTKNKNNIKIFYQDRQVHAKLFIADHQTAIFGSHNFVSTGGILGTEELAIKTTDQHLVQQLEEFIKTETN